ncbi:B12-binding domain-containing radical SAM protein [Mycobacterium parmense]|uniref:B12-binding domain-containing radical SAM protein n=1 Tax=Mycobacterium parmense TaxID=185642 RepID=A0A7I7YW36_9MYCO|nr:radical SAM protein [Mycobacterium parmense]MCV7350684.1 B12-binding domain-containing radical SAM protein [Mycobacterium parmense]ORW48381.1 radical SAM protein [Mycobacterium parmense]BBZ45889.1 B12-binding domain-containing radical SAM protein [Mycobacterium parmense]
MADIVLINPRFEVSYWGLEHALPLLGKKCNLPTACLPLLAALTPAGHSVTLLDENVEPIDYDRLARADIVGLTGMTVQRARMREILRELKARGVFTVVGGPWVSVKEDYFDGLTDVIFVGEAETTWPLFLDEWAQGRHRRRYEQTEATDMTTVPVPRYDLLKIKNYLFGSVQFSRGCPFQCEFCDIIVTFGRRPRLKTSAQVIAELEAMRKQHLRMAFIVDDNLIGNKVAVKELLRDLAAWQAAEGYPFTFFTEVSLNLAEDDELMKLMDAANIVTAFIGIESPNEESLRETKKYQNVRKGGSIVDRVRKVQDSGIEVWCGMIVGFDHDDARIFKAQHEFVRQTDIMHAMVGMLSAIPKTPLYARLEHEGRLDLDDEQVYGTNVIPLGMTREELRDGYIELMQNLYEPEFYFERLENLFLRREFDWSRARNSYWRTHRWQKWKSQSVDAVLATGLFLRLMNNIPDPKLRRIYRRRMSTMVRRRPEPGLLFICVIKCAMHYHHYTMAHQMGEQRKLVNTF